MPFYKGSAIMRIRWQVVVVACLACLFAVFSPVSGYPSDGKLREKKLLKKARKNLAHIKYDKAKYYYHKLLSLSPDNVTYNFEQGIAYYNSYVYRDSSIRYFEHALSHMHNDTIGEVFYYLGRAYHYVGRFEDAIAKYNEFKQFIRNNKPGMVLQRDVDRYIEMCNNGRKYYAAPDLSVKVENMGGEINSSFPEYAPVLNNAEDMIVYAARKKGSTGNRFYHDDKYYEDIYFSTLQDTVWSAPQKYDATDEYISSKINTRKHEAPIIYSDDGQKFFIYRKNHVWMSRLVDNKWTKPEKLNDEINSRGMGAHEPSVFMSADEKVLFVTSNRKGGFGGRDIWKSSKQEDGSWGAMMNLGPVINTIYDEDAPFMSPDGKTLYFSSKGHATMGGYDIFKTTWDSLNGTWTEPENLGSPINTPGDDIYYITNQKEDDGYYASSQKGGYGDMDIYHIQLTCENIPFTEVRGLVLAGKSRIPVGATIKITNNETGEDMGTFHSDPSTGKYLMVLPPEATYDLELSVDQYEYDHHETFTIPKQCDYYQLFQEIQVQFLRDSTKRIYAQQAHFYDAFFNINDKTAEAFKLDSIRLSQPLMKDTSMEQTVLLGILKHNKTLPAKGITISLINKGDTMIAQTVTDEQGIWRFDHLNAKMKYSLLINENDVQKQYYGHDTSYTSIVIAGKVFLQNLPDDDFNPPFLPVEGLHIMLVDASDRIVNVIESDQTGRFILDNLPGNDIEMAQLNQKMHIKKELRVFDGDDYRSAYVNTLDKDTTSLHYTEYVDVVYIEQVPETIPSPPDIIVFKNILFDFDKSDLREESKNELNRIYNYLREHENVAVEIHGHTDWIGSDAYNLTLSKRRALAAVNYLEQQSIDQNRIDFKYFGEKEPVVPNAHPDGSDDPLGRQLNRRCEFRFAPAGQYTMIVMKF